MDTKTLLANLKELVAEKLSDSEVKLAKVKAQQLKTITGEPDGGLLSFELNGATHQVQYEEDGMLDDVIYTLSPETVTYNDEGLATDESTKEKVKADKEEVKAKAEPEAETKDEEPSNEDKPQTEKEEGEKSEEEAEVKAPEETDPTPEKEEEKTEEGQPESTPEEGEPEGDKPEEQPTEETPKEDPTAEEQEETPEETAEGDEPKAKAETGYTIFSNLGSETIIFNDLKQ